MPFLAEILINQIIIIHSMFVAFSSFFPCSVTAVHRGRQRKSGGRQQKSSRAVQHHYILILLAHFDEKDHQKHPVA